MKKRKPGRPGLQNGETPNRSVRLPDKTWAAIETWRQRQTDKPSRNEAIRRLLGFALAFNPRLDAEKDD
jgi:hypothetical protein